MERKEDKGNKDSEEIFLPIAMHFIFDHQSCVIFGSTTDLQSITPCGRSAQIFAAKSNMHLARLNL